MKRFCVGTMLILLVLSFSLCAMTACNKGVDFEVLYNNKGAFFYNITEDGERIPNMHNEIVKSIDELKSLCDEWQMDALSNPQTDVEKIIASLDKYFFDKYNLVIFTSFNGNSSSKFIRKVKSVSIENDTAYIEIKDSYKPGAHTDMAVSWAILLAIDKESSMNVTKITVK